MPKITYGKNGQITTKRETRRHAAPQRSRIRHEQFAFMLLRKVEVDDVVFVTLDEGTEEEPMLVEYALVAEDIITAPRESEARNKIKRKYPHQKYIFDYELKALEEENGEG